ncbi:MAG TPA: SpoIIE family protein phosphatase [Armatimonadota bacterium]|nr:SpoIIE family protein phosphatase [Armatimonadota bacterium]
MNDRKTGIDVIGDVPWSTHFCQFYKTKQDLTDILVPYFKAGLESNEFCMWVTSEPLTVDEAESALRDAIPDLDDYLLRGQIDILPYIEWYLKEGVFNEQRVLDGWVDKLNQALAKGYDGLRLSGNTFWLEEAHWADFAAYEATVNSVIGSYRMLALCTYSLDKCGASEIAEVVGNHQFALIMREGKWGVIEIPEYTQAKELIRKERDFISAVLDTAGCLVVVLDSEGRIVRFNCACEQTTGCSSDQVKNRYFWDLFAIPEEAEAVRAVFAELQAGRFPSNFDGYWTTRDGNRRVISWSNTAIQDSSGTVGHVIATGIEITERKRAEEALRQTEQLLETALEHTHMLVAYMDPQFNFIWVNRAYAAADEKEPSFFPGKNHFVLYPNAENVELFQRVVETSQPYFASAKPFEYPEHPGRGASYWDWSLVPIKDAGGKVAALVLTLANITDHVRAAQQLRDSYERERRIAETLQKSLLPSVEVEVEGFSLAARYRAALEEAEVGGDFYDVFRLGDRRLALVIGDVSGKGLGAAVHTAMARYMLRAYAHESAEPGRVLQQLNEAMCTHVPEELFVTIFYGVLDTAARTLTYANAGHDEPLLYDCEGGCTARLEVTGPASGVIPGGAYAERTIELSPGDVLLLYTDGITDARSGLHFFGIDGLAEILAANSSRSESCIVDAVYQAAIELGEGDLGDDAAVLVLKAKTLRDSGSAD